MYVEKNSPHHLQWSAKNHRHHFPTVHWDTCTMKEGRKEGRYKGMNEWMNKDEPPERDESWSSRMCKCDAITSRSIEHAVPSGVQGRPTAALSRLSSVRRCASWRSQHRVSLRQRARSIRYDREKRRIPFGINTHCSPPSAHRLRNFIGSRCCSSASNRPHPDFPGAVQFHEGDCTDVSKQRR